MKKYSEPSERTRQWCNRRQLRCVQKLNICGNYSRLGRAPVSTRLIWTEVFGWLRTSPKWSIGPTKPATRSMKMKKTKVPNTFRFSVDDTRGSQATSTSSPLLLIYPISVDLEFLYKNTRISATSYWNISSRYDASSYYKSCIMQIITIFEIQYEIA